MNSHTLGEPDRGASAITIAIMMVLFMGIAAIAVDLGLGFNERRVDQTSADTGVMAGAVEIVLGGSYQSAVDEVIDYVTTNVGPVNPADWAIGACQDPNQLITTAADLGLNPATECISFETLEKIRVRIPNQAVDTGFSQFVGLSELTTSAAAEALAIQFPGAANSPPFVTLSTASAGDQICLRTSPQATPLPHLMVGNGASTPGLSPTEPDPCDETVYDPNSDFFGALDPNTYFNHDTGEITCKSGLLDFAIAAGIDHTLSQFEPDFVVGTTSPTGGQVVEEDCAPVPVAGVNTMPLNTGLSAAQLRCGMLTARSGVCSGSVSPGPAGGSNVNARLHLGPWAPSGQTFLGEDMDNKPLWDFMSSPVGTWPTACDDLYTNRTNPAWDYFDKKDALASCLTTWSDGDGKLFSTDINMTPRFAWLPILAESNLTTEPSSCPSSAAAKCVHFNDFVPVYMQTLYTLITGGSSAGACDDPLRTGVAGPQPRWGRHDAGEPINCGNNNGNLDRLSSFVLDCAMLPDEICDARPGTHPGGDVDPILELTK